MKKVDFDELERKKDEYLRIKPSIPAVSLASYDRAFEIEFAHHSTAIEGNTLSLIQTKVILEDGMSSGNHSLREIFELVNHEKCFKYIKQCVKDGKPLSEPIVLKIHSLITENIFPGGIYRDVEVRVTGAGFYPPSPIELPSLLRWFYEELETKKHSLHPIAYAAWTHAEFVRIHPFTDGNGRTARMLMNYQLMLEGYLPISIAKDDRYRYYDALNRYAMDDACDEFTALVAELENQRLDQYLAITRKS